MIWTKEFIESKIKSRVQYSIDKDSGITEANWKEQNSKYRASVKSPGKGTMQSLVSYLTLPNVDYDIAKSRLTFRQSDLEWPVKHMSFDEFIDNHNKGIAMGNVWVSGVENALYEMKQRYPKQHIIKDPGKFVVRLDEGHYVVKLTRSWLYYGMYASSAKKFQTAKQADKRVQEKVISRGFKKVVNYKVLELT